MSNLRAFIALPDLPSDNEDGDYLPNVSLPSTQSQDSPNPSQPAAESTYTQLKSLNLT